jgi:hypothetical protein
MATVETFEELQVWQDARQLVKVIYAETRRRPFALALSRRLARFIRYLEGFQGKTRVRKSR